MAHFALFWTMGVEQWSYSFTFGVAAAQALGACFALPVALVRAAEDEPAAATEMKPKHEDAQTLFRTWLASE